MPALPLVFTILSVHQETELHCRIYCPPAEQLTGPRKRGAIIAHPLASLGGSCDDPAVLAAVFALLEKGFVVGTFNFRGAKPSKGSTSWSGKAEVEDYVSFVGFFLHFLKQLSWTFTRTRRASAPATPARQSPNSRQRSKSCGTHDGVLTEVKAAIRRMTHSSRRSSSPAPLPIRERRPITLILGGYSYGAVILSHLPSIQAIVERFANPAPLSTEAKIVETSSLISAHANAKIHAEESEGSITDNSISSDSVLSRKHPKAYIAKHLPNVVKRGRKHVEPETFEDPGGAVGATFNPRHSRRTDSVVTSYLFISPVVSALRKFLYWGPSADDTFWSHRVLVIHGRKDGFASVSAVEKWIANPKTELKILENGHLWVETSAQRELMSIIGRWATQIT